MGDYYKGTDYRYDGPCKTSGDCQKYFKNSTCYTTNCGCNTGFKNTLTQNNLPCLQQNYDDQKQLIGNPYFNTTTGDGKITKTELPKLTADELSDIEKQKNGTGNRWWFKKKKKKKTTNIYIVKILIALIIVLEVQIIKVNQERCV